MSGTSRFTAISVAVLIAGGVAYAAASGINTSQTYTQPPSSLEKRTTNAEGTSLGHARADHKHDTSALPWPGGCPAGRYVIALDGGTGPTCDDAVDVAGDTMTGRLILQSNAGSQVLDLKANAIVDHVYMALYGDSDSPSTRSGYFGYPNAGSNVLTIANETNGNINLITGGILQKSGSTVWHAGNDGAGSTLDADLLDGLTSTDFEPQGNYSGIGACGADQFAHTLNTSAAPSCTIPSLIDAYASPGDVTANPPAGSGWLRTLTNSTGSTGFPTAFGVFLQMDRFADGSTSATGATRLWASTSDDQKLFHSKYVHNGTSGTWKPWALIWTEGTDGTGSGLDADLVDGLSSGDFLRDNGDTATGSYNFTGPVTVSAGGGGFDLKATTGDHTYMEFFADTENQSTRSGYFGFTSGGNTTMSVVNEFSGGSLQLNTTGNGTVSLNAGTGNINLNAGAAVVNGNLTVNKGNAAATGVEVGDNGGGFSTLIDLHAGPTYTDYATRILRSAGDNGAFTIEQRGTGAMTLKTNEAASLWVMTNNTNRANWNGTSGLFTTDFGAEIGGGNNVLRLKPGATADRTYMEFFPDSQSATTRWGFFGFSVAANTEMHLNNEVGDITLWVPNTTTGSTVGIRGNVAGAREILATRPYVNSRGMNLFTNGTGLLGYDYGFSVMDFSQSETAYGNGAFYTDTNNFTGFSDEYLPVDPGKSYELRVWAKNDLPNNALNHAYIGGVFFDADNQQISPQHHMFQAGTSTTLAAPLTPGDTTITLTSSASWYTGASTFLRTYIIWGYKNAKGYVYPPFTYSRYSLFDAYPQVGGISGNVITLNAPFPAAHGNPNDVNGTWPVGTPISNGASGGTYKYFVLSNQSIPQAWTEYRGTVGGLDLTGTNQTTQFPPGAVSMKVLFLANRHNDGVTNIGASRTYLSNVWFSEVTPGNMSYKGVSTWAKASAPGGSFPFLRIFSPNNTVGGGTGADPQYIEFREATANTGEIRISPGDDNNSLQDAVLFGRHASGGAQFFPGFKVANDGKVYFDSGTTETPTWDVNLYRESADLLRTDDSLNVRAPATDTRLEVGNDTGSNGSWLDLHGSATYTDWAMRLSRSAGDNGGGRLEHRGTGNLAIRTVDAAIMSLETNNTQRVTIGATSGLLRALFGVEADGGAASMSMKPGTQDHAYLAIYADSDNATTRTGYVGYPSAGSTTLTISNEVGGAMSFETSATQRLLVDDDSIDVGSGMSFYSPFGMAMDSSWNASYSFADASTPDIYGATRVQISSGNNARVLRFTGYNPCPPGCASKLPGDITYDGTFSFDKPVAVTGNITSSAAVSAVTVDASTAVNAPNVSVAPIMGSGATNSQSSASSSTYYSAPMWAGWSTTDNRTMPMPTAGVLKRLYVRCNSVVTATGGGSSIQITVRKNDVDTAITVTVPDGSQEGSDLTNSVSFAAGDRISFKAVLTGGTTQPLQANGTSISVAVTSSL